MKKFNQQCVLFAHTVIKKESQYTVGFDLATSET